MLQPEGERKPPVGFDVAKIAARMKGWDLRQPDSKDENWFVLSREHEGKHLDLRMNSKKGFVSFRERSLDSQPFSVNCEEIRDVIFDDYTITFYGDVIYEISFNGAFHDIKSDSNRRSIVTRGYKFPENLT